MRVCESCNSHPLSLTLIDFELVQILTRVDVSLCVFDQSRQLMKVAKLPPVSKLSKIVQSGPVNKRIPATKPNIYKILFE